MTTNPMIASQEKMLQDFSEKTKSIPYVVAVYYTGSTATYGTALSYVISLVNMYLVHEFVIKRMK